MRYHFTASLITALLLSSCGESQKTDAEPFSTAEVTQSNSPQSNSAKSKSGKSNSGKSKATQAELPSTKSSASKPSASNLATAKVNPSARNYLHIDSNQAAFKFRFEGLDPRDISQAEIDELIALEKEQAERQKEYRKDIMAWQRQDPTTRGERPQMQSSPRSQIDIDRTQELNGKIHIAGLRKQYRALDSDIISQAEIDELIDLQRVQSQFGLEYQKKMAAWSAQDAATRGEYPKFDMPPRLQELNAKVQMASLRKQYEDLDPQFISKGEVDELVLLQQEQMKMHLEIQAKFQDWSNQDPATRGPQPEYNLPQAKPDFRLQELQMKVNSANQVKHMKQRVEGLSQTHNISLSDSDINQLTALQIEQQKLQAEYQTTVMKWSQQQQVLNPNDTLVYDATNYDKRPQPDPRLGEIQRQINEIQAPLHAAEAAKNMRIQLTTSSEQFGVTLLSSEIEETIELNAEKTRLQNKYRNSGLGGSYGIGYTRFNGTGVDGSDRPTDEDYARIKEIEARLKAISAPITDAQNAQRDATHPGAKQQRLEQEKRLKWAEEWQDKKQAGEVPWNAPMHSPSYAELLDQSKNFRKELKKHADEGGFYVSEMDAQRLESLNDDMLAIRKTVYEMETGGQALVEQENGAMTPSFGVAAGMYKIRLLKAKQARLGIELMGQEGLERALEKSGIAAGDFESQKIILEHMMKQSGPSAESFIEGFRNRGIEVSQSDADDLIAFDESMAD